MTLSQIRGWAALAGAATILSCVAPDEPRFSEPLADVWSWRQATRDEDPFHDRPSHVSCPEEALVHEQVNGDWALEVTTGLCEYAALTQETLVDILPGDEVHVRVWHFELDAPDAGEAHVALAIDGEVVWEAWRDIPSPGGLLTDTWIADRSVPAGSSVVFHLHNHGVNSWVLFPPTRAVVEE